PKIGYWTILVSSADGRNYPVDDFLKSQESHYDLRPYLSLSDKTDGARPPRLFTDYYPQKIRLLFLNLGDLYPANLLFSFIFKFGIKQSPDLPLVSCF
ncbi:hypothetical protein, partial [Streptococcus sobrinus]|uniref:hypothetical protein n=1 Tax=Streptococcus sobrinus TaxID=1310 RepID=UPI001C3F9ACE